MKNKKEEKIWKEGEKKVKKTLNGREGKEEEKMKKGEEKKERGDGKEE